MPSVVSTLKSQALKPLRELAVACEAANEKDFALILSDIDLPGIDGFEICRRIKQNPQLRSIPIILMSGRLPETTEPMAFQLGAVDYLSKPFKTAVLSKIFAHINPVKPSAVT
jgi:CheY-like chemotaxis protein